MEQGTDRYTLELHDYVTNNGSVTVKSMTVDEWEIDEALSDLYEWLLEYDAGDLAYYPVLIRDNVTGDVRCEYIELL